MSVRVLTSDFGGRAPRVEYDVWRLRQQVFVIEQD